MKELNTVVQLALELDAILNACAETYSGLFADARDQMEGARAAAALEHLCRMAAQLVRATEDLERLTPAAMTEAVEEAVNSTVRNVQEYRSIDEPRKP